MEVSLKGNISAIMFYNAENGYTVLQLETADGDVTCVGYLPSVSVGEELSIKGKLTSHPRYGEQISITDYAVANPVTKDAIVRYLSGGLLKGVGEVTAKNIYDVFGAKSLDVIIDDPMQLVKVRGISTKRALDIGNGVAELKKMQAQIMYLQQCGLTTNMALKIYNVYKEATKAVVSQNPYKLIDDIDGVGFITADRIALNMGHARDGEFRIRAALIYALKDSAEKQGNTFLYADDLFAACEKLLGLQFDSYVQLVENILTKMVLEPVIKVFEADGRRAIALIRYYALEKSIASGIMRLSRDARRLMLNADAQIAAFEKAAKIQFHPSQLSAVRSAVTNGVTVITGGPGTGKTTIIRCIAEIFENAGLRVEFCAPTGRAAKRLSQSTGREAKTIHRMLGYENRDGKMCVSYDQYNPLPCDAVVVDELSMVDVVIMHSLLRAIASGTRLVLVGDKDQLPSVGAGNVLADLIASKTVEVKYLTFVYRQSEDSLIVSNAHLINHGKMPEINNSSKDFFFTTAPDPETLAETVVQLVSRRLPKFTKVAATEIQVLGPLKSGAAGVESLNVRLQKALNPPSPSKKEIFSGRTVFRVGDRVMQTVNDYELPYTRENGGVTESGQGVFNGDIGFVSEIIRSEGIMKVAFDDGRLAEYSLSDLSNLTLAYAVTVHKSQGSEFDVVVVTLVNGPPTIINKNLLYTAITRAKKLVVLAGSKKVLAMMVHNNYVAARTTLLERFLRDEKLRFDTFFGTSESTNNESENNGDV